jgi:alkylation response protein AidB-like acyl-CoA dehydrogenase
MDFRFKTEELAVLKEVQAIMKEDVTPELVQESLDMGLIYGAPRARAFIQKLGSRGLLTPDWPEKYGGRGTSEMVTYMIRDELAYALTPYIFVGAHMAGPAILKYGTEEMKQKYLLPIARGEIEFALGYTEPGAGSDLAAISIEAEDRGDHYLVNGQKTFNTHSHVADYHWLAARTNFDAPKHRGISLFIVDLKSPGIEIRPMITMAGWQTNEVYYNDVMVPKENLVGDLNSGFYYVMTALDYERMVPPGAYRRLFDEIAAYARETKRGGDYLSQDLLVRQKLAQMATELEICELLYFQLPYMLDQEKPTGYMSSMEKLFVTEVMQRIAETGMDILGLFGQLKKGSFKVPLDGMVELFSRWSVVETIYGGTSEIQKNIMALRGLKLPIK